MRHFWVKGIYEFVASMYVLQEHVLQAEEKWSMDPQRAKNTMLNNWSIGNPFLEISYLNS